MGASDDVVTGYDLRQQLWRQTDRIDDVDERAALLALNLRGGVRAKSASAYEAAVAFLAKAEELLPEQAWQRDPELALSLHRNLAEAEYLAGRFDLAEARLDQHIASAPSVAAKVTLCLVQSDQMQIRGRFEISPSSKSMSSPFARAETLPRLPPGMISQSGTCQSSCWTISMPTVFWPSTRRLFIELAR